MNHCPLDMIGKPQLSPIQTESDQIAAAQIGLVQSIEE